MAVYMLISTLSVHHDVGLLSIVLYLFGHYLSLARLNWGTRLAKAA